MGTATNTYTEQFRAGVLQVPVIGAGLDEGAMSVATSIDAFEAAQVPATTFSDNGQAFLAGLADALQVQGTTQGTMFAERIAEYQTMFSTALMQGANGDAAFGPELFTDPATSVSTALGSALGEGGENGAGSVSDVVNNLAEAGANFFGGNDDTDVAIYGRNLGNNVEITADAVQRVATAVEEAITAPLMGNDTPEFDPATYAGIIETELLDIVQNSLEGNLLGTNENPDSAAKNVRDIADGVSSNLLNAGETVGRSMVIGGDIVYTAAVNQGSRATASVIDSMGRTGILISESIRGADTGMGYNGEIADAVEMVTEAIQTGSSDLEAGLLGALEPVNPGAETFGMTLVENARELRTGLQDLRMEIEANATEVEGMIAQGAQDFPLTPEAVSSVLMMDGMTGGGNAVTDLLDGLELDPTSAEMLQDLPTMLSGDPMAPDLIGDLVTALQTDPPSQGDLMMLGDSFAPITTGLAGLGEAVSAGLTLPPM